MPILMAQSNEGKGLTPKPSHIRLKKIKAEEDNYTMNERTPNLT